LDKKCFTYKTIASPSAATHRVLGSKHLAFAFPVSSIEDVKEHLEKLKRDYHDASHVCYAWRLGWEKKNYRHSDAGEPSGTAGRPIFGQLLSHDLTDVLVAVVRYFGGTKLGTGGLMDAYKTAAKLALDSATIVEREARERWVIEFPYAHIGPMMKMVKDHHLEKISMEQGDPGKLEVFIPLFLLPEIQQKLAGLEGILMQKTEV